MNMTVWATGIFMIFVVITVGFLLGLSLYNLNSDLTTSMISMFLGFGLGVSAWIYSDQQIKYLKEGAK